MFVSLRTNNVENSPDGLIYKYDVSVAKTYLNEEELNKLNDLTNMFLVFAEDETKERHIMLCKIGLMQPMIY